MWASNSAIDQFVKDTEGDLVSIGTAITQKSYDLISALRDPTLSDAERAKMRPFFLEEQHRLQKLDSRRVGQVEYYLELLDNPNTPPR